MLTVVGGRYGVFVDGNVLEASLRGRMKHRSPQQVLVGDMVELVQADDGSATIGRILPRRTVLKRRMPGRRRGIRNVAANVDQIMVVGSAARPPWDPSLIDRFVVVAEANSLPCVVVVNKSDLAEDAVAQIAPYRAAGYATITTSAKDGRGIDELRAALANRVSLFTGPTGVGKSSLANAVEPGLELRTGEVSEKSGSGRHTTVAAEMHPLTGGGFIVDTPGLRDIGLWGMEPGEVVQAFPDLGEYAANCRFANCRHLQEPNCAVVEAVKAGSLAESRVESYRRLLAEAAEAARQY